MTTMAPRAGRGQRAAIVLALGQDDESWFSEDELERSSAIPLDSIALDGLVRGHDRAVWDAHRARRRLSLQELPGEDMAHSGSPRTDVAQWGMGQAGAALGALGPGEILAVFGDGGRPLHVAHALALQLADGLALAAARTLEPGASPEPNRPLTPTLTLCGAGHRTATLSFLARCGAARLSDLLGAADLPDDGRVRACLERHRALEQVMRHVRTDEVLRGVDLLESLQARLSAFVADVRARAQLVDQDRVPLIPALVLTTAGAWLGRGEDEEAFVRAFGSMVRHAGAIGVIGGRCPGPMHRLCDVAFRIEPTPAGLALALAHHRSQWPRRDRFDLQFDASHGRVIVGAPLDSRAASG